MHRATNEHPAASHKDPYIANKGVRPLCSTWLPVLAQQEGGIILAKRLGARCGSLDWIFPLFSLFALFRLLDNANNAKQNSILTRLPSRVLARFSSVFALKRSPFLRRLVTTPFACVILFETARAAECLCYTRAFQSFGKTLYRNGFVLEQDFHLPRVLLRYMHYCCRAAATRSWCTEASTFMLTVTADRA